MLPGSHDAVTCLDVPTAAASPAVSLRNTGGPFICQVLVLPQAVAVGLSLARPQLSGGVAGACKASCLSSSRDRLRMQHVLSAP